jgi:3-hydroxyacyl-[acyl-carrier protein] dehydratase/trans-2-decenoyl-[acyl-carrier protein] isomerase
VKYDAFLARDRFDKPELLAFAHGALVEDPPEDFDARLPAPPFLMFDRITEISRDGRRGRVVAEQDVVLDAWYFQCHFRGDPVQPGCLGVDAVWQLLGFYCVWAGGVGSGRALGAGEIDFAGQIRPHDRVVSYEVDVRRLSRMKGGACVAVGDALVRVDDAPVYTIRGARAGLFTGIAYRDYPQPGENARGGPAERG